MCKALLRVSNEEARLKSLLIQEQGGFCCPTLVVMEKTSGPATTIAPTTSIRHSKSIVLTEAGRSPWYDANGVPQDAYIVGVAGGSASGKTSVAKAILDKLPKVPWVGIVSQDSFYKSLSKSQSRLAFENNYNFDHPNAFDHDLLKECIAECVLFFLGEGVLTERYVAQY